MKRKKVKRVYKAQPPYVNLTDVLKIIEQVYLKCAGSASRDSFSGIIDNSLTSSSYNKKLNTCKNFGLLKEEFKKIFLTDLAKRIVVPHNEEERAIAKKEAFLNIKIFQDVYERFCGKILDPSFLPNFFEREIKIDNEVKNRWAKSFVECAQTAELLRIKENGTYVVLEGGEASPLRETEDINETKDNVETIEIIDPKPTQKESLIVSTYEEEAGYNRSKVSLSDGKFAEFLIPECSKAKDARKLKAHLEALKIMIEGNVDEKVEE